MLHRIASLACGVVLALGSFGCAALTPPLTCPARGGAPWTELASTHFTMRTDVPPEEGRSVLTELEGVYTAFKDVAFPSTVDPQDRIEVVLFAREKDYAALAPPNSGGYFTARPAKMVLPGGLTLEAKLTLQHELTHHFLVQILGEMPPWLSEGMAQFYSTLRVEDGHAYLGDPVPNRAFTVGLTGRTIRRDPWNVTMIPTLRVPSVDTLLHADRGTFYVHSARPTYDEGATQTAFYGGAWALVHMLNNGPEAYRTRFNAFIAAMTRGVPSARAWSQAFGDVDPARFEDDFRRYLVRPETTLQVTTYTPRPSEPPRAQWLLSDAEVHVLWAKLRPWTEREGARAKLDLDEAMAEDPSSPEVHFVRGLFALQQKQLAEADRELSWSLTAKPMEPRYLLGLAMVLRNDTPATRLPPATLKRLDDVTDRLGKVATSAEELNFVGWHDAETGRVDEGLSLAERAVKLDPTCWECLDTYALLLSQKNRFDEALAAETRAVDRIPESVQSEGAVERLHRYGVIARAMARRRQEAPTEAAKPAE